MSMPQLPKNFASAVDLSQLGKPPVATSNIAGLEISQENLVNQVLPISAKKVVIVICWSPRSEQSISLLEVMGKYNQADTSESGEPSWILGRVNVDDQPAVSQALQVQSVPLAIAIIQEQLVPLFEAVPPADQIRLVLDKVLTLAAERGVGSAPDPAQAPEVPMEPEEVEAMTAMEAGDFRKAKSAYEKLLARKPGEAMAKLGLAQTELLIRIEGLNPQDIMAKATANPNDLDLALSAADLEIANGQNKAAFDRMIKMVKISSGDDRKRVQEHLVTLFLLVDPQDPDLLKARQQLASALF
jgi:putative thioredoxin